MALEVTDRIWGCSDFGELLMTSIAGAGVTGEQAECLLDKIGEGPVKSLVAVSFMGAAGSTLEDSASSSMFTAGLQATSAGNVDV